MVGKIHNKEEDAFEILLQLDTVRGPHSTGVVSVTNKGWEYLKVAGTPWELFEMKGWQQLMACYHTALIGHNRWATVGDVTNDNAHPFAHGSFIGVHNGTLKNTEELIDAKKFQTDSEAIYYNMSIEGPEKTIEVLDGAFALAWYNDEESTVQLVRNYQRPLYLCRSKDGLTYFFASEPWMLKVALSKVGIEYNDPTLIDIDTLISIPCQNKSQQKEMLLARIKKVTVKSEPVKTTVVYNYKGGRSNTVVPFPNSGTAYTGKKSKVGLKDYLGKVVKFSVGRLCEANNMHYVSCLLEEDSNDEAEIRVYVKPSSKLARTLLESRQYFGAKIKRITASKGGEYMLVDNRTITEIDDFAGGVEDANKEEKIPVYNGQKVSIQGWYECTESGCAWCSNYPLVQTADKLHWFGRKQFLCDVCKHDPEVMSYTIN